MLLHQTVLAQNNTFRRDYGYIQFYKEGKWESPTSGDNTVVFNANQNSDIIIYTANGEKKTLRGISDAKKDTNKHGVSFQYRLMLDEEGHELQMFFLDDGDTILAYNFDSEKHLIMIGVTH
jgi:hypothetical protein